MAKRKKKTNRIIDYHNKEVVRIRKMEKTLGMKPLLIDSSDLKE